MTIIKTFDDFKKDSSFTMPKAGQKKIYLVTETYTKNGDDQYYNAPVAYTETREEVEKYLIDTADTTRTYYPEVKETSMDENTRSLQYTDDEGNDDREQNLLGFGYLTKSRHLYLTLLLCSKKLHKRRLNHRNKSHIAICRYGDGP